MSLSALPVEVLEILFQYVNVRDLPTLWEIVGLESSDLFWKRICNREGYKKITREECWNTVFYRNINWALGKFVKRVYKFENYTEQLFDCGNISSVYCISNNLILKSDESKLYIWNIDKNPVVVQEMSVNRLHACGSTLIVCSKSNETKIFINNGTFYEERFSLTYNFLECSEHDYVLNYGYFVTLDRINKQINVVNLETIQQFNILVSPKNVKFMQILLSEAILNLLVLNGSEYVLMRYSLDRSVWLENILLFQGATLISVPYLKISRDIIVSWSNFLARDGITPVKVWNTGGGLLKTLPFEFLFSSRVLRNTQSEEIKWLAVKGEYVILSSLVTSITIWHAKHLGSCKELAVNQELYYGHKIISSSLLLLIYTNCFKVVNFRSTEYLYEVRFEAMELKLLANECFFIFLSKSDDGTEQTGETISKDYLNSNIKERNISNSKEIGGNKETHTLTIYDFRGQ